MSTLLIVASPRNDPKNISWLFTPAAVLLVLKVVFWKVKPLFTTEFVWLGFEAKPKVAFDAMVQPSTRRLVNDGVADAMRMPSAPLDESVQFTILTSSVAKVLLNAMPVPPLAEELTLSKVRFVIAAGPAT